MSNSEYDAAMANALKRRLRSTVRPRDLVASSDAALLAATKAAIHLDDLSTGAAIAHLNETVTHGQTLVQQAQQILAGLMVVAGGER